MAQFKTKARAVELLGKGQIADLPTAISELWKNGYDAYAKNLGCNLYLTEYEGLNHPLFMLYDDGFGMTEQDILTKWIVLGTDSKARGPKTYTNEERFGISPRVPMGEKGIGRLSVAYLGSPMVMITRKIGCPVELLYIDWRVLENYNMFIDDVDIPLSHVSSQSQLSSELRHMAANFMASIINSQIRGLWDGQEKLYDVIIKDNELSYLPDSICHSDQIENLFRDNGHGTIFIVFNPDDQLLELGSDAIDKDDSSTLEIKKSLCGIFNLFKDEPDFNTYFNLYNKAGNYNIINEFFTKKDFESGDWFIKGQFDQFGMFNGIVRVFKEIFPYKFRPLRIPGKTPYGPFTLELAGIEGQTKSSLLSPEEYARMEERTTNFGALYLYRDNFRVLPYGRVDYDFLQFEKRRSLKAGRYYFSHRNMFGYLSITRKDNPLLKDKAGREGLIENKAYKEFRRDLIDLFKDVADKYFRSVNEGESNARSEQIKEIEAKNNRLLALEKKKEAQTKKRFNEALKTSTPELQRLESDIKELLTKISEKGNQISVDFNEYDELVSELELKKKELLGIKLSKPARAKLSSLQEERFIVYSQSYNNTVKIINDCESQISSVRNKFGVANLQKDYEKRNVRALTEISQLVNSYRNRFQKVFNDTVKQFGEQQMYYTDLFRETLKNFDVSSAEREFIKRAINEMVSVSDQIKNTIQNRFDPFINHIEGLNFDIDEDYLVKWYKEQHESLSEQLERTNGLAQLGISAEIIDHELNHLYLQMRKSMEDLGSYVESHDELRNLYSQLDSAFVQIENNYQMLQPFYHTRRRINVDFTGDEIIKGLKSFFASKLEVGSIDIFATDSFKHYHFNAPEAVIYTTFINIVDNAIHWLIPVNNRLIKIDYREDQITIMNSGIPIEDSELEKIFALFYTRKVNGRGIGLYLAQRSLREIGLDIYATNDKKINQLGGACFVICKYENHE